MGEAVPVLNRQTGGEDDCALTGASARTTKDMPRDAVIATPLEAIFARDLPDSDLRNAVGVSVAERVIEGLRRSDRVGVGCVASLRWLWLCLAVWIVRNQT